MDLFLRVSHFLSSSMADFAPCDRLVENAYLQSYKILMNQKFRNRWTWEESITLMCWYVPISLFLVIVFLSSLLSSWSACTGEHALGLENGLVTDQQMSASSFSVSHEPSQGRLNLRVGRGKKGAWCSRTKDQNQFLQVDFWRNVKITKIATQGRQDYSQWVTQYKLSYAVDGSTVFQTYQEMGDDKVRENMFS